MVGIFIGADYRIIGSFQTNESGNQNGRRKSGFYNGVGTIAATAGRFVYPLGNKEAIYRPEELMPNCL
jgi:hypothetical protein